MRVKHVVTSCVCVCVCVYGCVCAYVCVCAVYRYIISIIPTCSLTVCARPFWYNFWLCIGLSRRIPLEALFTPPLPTLPGHVSMVRTTTPLVNFNNLTHKHCIPFHTQRLDQLWSPKVCVCVFMYYVFPDPNLWFSPSIPVALMGTLGWVKKWKLGKKKREINSSSEGGVRSWHTWYILLLCVGVGVPWRPQGMWGVAHVCFFCVYE